MKKATSRAIKILMAFTVIFLGLKAGSMQVFAYDYSSVTITPVAKTFYADKDHMDYWNVELLSFDVVVGGLNGKSIDSCTLSCSVNSGEWSSRYERIGGNILRFHPYRIPVNNAKLTITFGDEYEDICVTKEVTINIIGVSMTGGGDGYLIKGKTRQLKISGYSGSVSWKSSRPTVVSINSAGKVKALKEGSSLITATLSDGTKLGFVINAVSSSRYKIVKKAIYIGSHWKYSQKKRMSNGYYDCSSLVWKAYKAGGRKLVSGSYAPTAADLGKWCVKHKKIPKGNVNTNLSKMVYKPGALIFGTGAKNGRYKGIYHVEMLVGYRFDGFSDGKPIITNLWGNRVENYGYSYSNLVAQPF